MFHISEERGEFHIYFAAICGLILMVALVVAAVSYATVGKIFRTITEVASAAGVTELSQNIEVEHVGVAVPDAIALALIAVLLFVVAAKYARIKPAGPSAESDKPRTRSNTLSGSGKFWGAEQARSKVHDLHFDPRPPMVLSARTANRRRYLIDRIQRN